MGRSLKNNLYNLNLEQAVAGALSKFGIKLENVYEQEPVDPKNPLFTLPNFIGTPHTAAESYENYDRCGCITAQAIIDVAEGKEPQNILTK